AKALQRIAQVSGVQVVCVAGLTSGPQPAIDVAHGSAEELADALVAEIERGIGATGVRAGLLGSIGSSPAGGAPPGRWLFEAVALAQRRTGCALATLAPSAAQGSQQLELLLAHGADARKVLVGHLDGGPTALGACVAVARRGAYVGIDRVGDSLAGSDDD